MLSIVMPAVQHAMIMARADALGANKAKRFGWAISTSPTVSGCKIKVRLKIASACVPTPYSAGVRK